jgi:signal transduction histidine kinase
MKPHAAPSAFAGYAVAAGGVAGAIALKLVFAPLFGHEAPFSFLFAAIVVAAWYGGLGPALVSIGLAVAAVDYIFLSPYGSFMLTPVAAARLAVFFVEACFVSALAGRTRVALARAEASAEKRRVAEDRLERENRARRALSSCNEALVRTDDEATLLRRMCEAIVEVAAYQMCWIGRAEHDEAKTVRPMAFAGSDEGFLDGANVTWADEERGRGPTGTAIRTGRPAVRQELATSAPAPQRDAALARGYASSLALPITIDGEIYGAITIYASVPDAFDADEVSLLTELSGDIGYGMKSLRARNAEQRARRLVDEERDRFASVIMQMPVAVALLSGPRHIMRLVNPRWVALGETAGLPSPLGRPAGQRLPERERRPILAVLDEVFVRGEPRTLTEFPLTLVLDGGEPRTRYFSAAFQPLRDIEGKVTDIVAAVVEVTEQVAARHAVEVARAAAERTSRAKDEFLRIASHELRTPLTPLLGWAQMLKRVGAHDPQKLARGLDVILESARAEARLIGDLLDVSRSIAGDLQMKEELVELTPLIAACVEQVRRTADERGIAIEASIATDATVVGDAVRLRQVAQSLLSNALKFTPRGGRVDVDLVSDDGLVRFSVHDTGRGISAVEVAHLFDVLRPGDRSMTRREPGLGLGLALVRAIVEKHGGRVHGESAGPDRGATFVVELPKRRAEASA